MIGRAWEPEEDALLAAMVLERRSFERMAARLPGRTVIAVRTRVRQHRAVAAGVRDNPAPPEPMGKVDFAELRASLAAKPASERWPYTMPAIRERVPMPGRPATHVYSGSSLS